MLILAPFWDWFWLIFCYLFDAFFGLVFLSLRGAILMTFGAYFRYFFELGCACDCKKWFFWKPQKPWVKQLISRVGGSPRSSKLSNCCGYFRYRFSRAFFIAFRATLAPFLHHFGIHLVSFFDTFSMSGFGCVFRWLFGPVWSRFWLQFWTPKSTPNPWKSEFLVNLWINSAPKGLQDDFWSPGKTFWTLC